MVDGFVESWSEPGQVVETNMAALRVTHCKSDSYPVCYDIASWFSHAAVSFYRSS
jgi:hypothetical protein